MALIQYITRIQFDFGAISLLGEETARLGLTRPLIVTDPGVAEAGILDRAMQALKPIEPIVFAETPENPTEAALRTCLELWRSEGCDGAIAIGGGSCLDLSKAAALLISHGGAFGDYGVKTGGSERIGPVAPHLAVPTAAGTGAEVGRAAVMTLDDGRKTAAVNLNMVAGAVICDPELTFSLPPRLTAATGIDALSHGIEAWLTPVENPPAGAIALDCVRRAAANLRAAVEDGGNRSARWEMMMAALMGGLALQKGLGSVHAMSHPLGELHLHHGTLNAVLLPHVLRFNAPVSAEKYAMLRQAIGLEPDADIAEWIEMLNAAIGMPKTLSELGVDPKLIPDLADKASKDHLSATNPRPADVSDYDALLRAAM